MLETLGFPRFRLQRYAREKRKILLSLGGRVCDVAFLAQIAPTFDTLYAVDKGLDIFCDTEIVPNFVIGDLDSAKPRSIEFATRHQIETIRLKRDKDDTDFQATLKFAKKQEKCGANEKIAVGVINSLGGRLDHLLSNIFTFANIHSSFTPFFMGDEKEIVFFLHGKEALAFDFDVAPRHVSLLAMSRKVTGVNLTGVKWGLSNATLKQNEPYTISNEVRDSRVTVCCSTGLLAFYILFSEEGIS